MNDIQIVELYLSRDENAIKETSIKFGARLRSLAFQITNDTQTSEECETDTYLKAWNAIPPHEPRSYLYAFLARITRHLALNCCRSRNQLKRSAYICELTTELEQCLPSSLNVEHCVDDIVFAELLNGFLKKLGKEKRLIFLRRYWYLDSVADISKRLSLSESKVKTTLFRCRNKLREHLEKEGYTI